MRTRGGQDFLDTHWPIGYSGPMATESHQRIRLKLEHPVWRTFVHKAVDKGLSPAQLATKVLTDFVENENESENDKPKKPRKKGNQ